MIPVLTPIEKAIIAVVGILLIILAFWLALHFYGAHMKAEGASAADAKWEAAGYQLRTDASNAAANATANAAANQAVHDAQQQADQAAVNKAEAEGKSPLDAIFGN